MWIFHKDTERIGRRLSDFSDRKVTIAYADFMTGYEGYFDKADMGFADVDYELLISCPALNFEDKYEVLEKEAFDHEYSYLQKGEKISTNRIAWDVSIDGGKKAALWLYEDVLFRVPCVLAIKLEWNGHDFEAADVQLTHVHASEIFLQMIPGG